MLRITVPATRLWDAKTQQFYYTKETKLSMEHSLVAIKNWESKYLVPWLSNERKKTAEEWIYYFQCMTITQNVDPLVYYALTESNIVDIFDYIEKPHTATKIKRTSKKSSNEQTTAETLYAYMALHHIPFECQKWHLDNLIKLIEVCSIKSQPPEKMSKADIYARNRAWNEAARKKYHSKG